MGTKTSWNSIRPLHLWEWLVLFGALSLFLAQILISSPQKSAAFDEQYHLAAGYAYLKTGDFRLSRTVGHPPLANLLNALPLLFLPELELPLDHPAWQNGNFQWFSETFLWQVNENPQQMIELARVSSAILGVLTALLLFLWGRQLAGPLAGWLALILAIFDPNLMANARLITTDLALTFFGLLAIWRLWSWLDRPNRLNLILVGLTAGFTMAVKYTGLLIWPIFFSIALLYPGITFRRLESLAFSALIAYFVIWAMYSFDIGPLSGSSIPIPAPVYPEAIWRTFNYINQQPVPAYLFGQVSSDGWWYYFPVTLAVKTPIPLMILALIGAIAGFFHFGWRRISVLWLPPLLYLLLTMIGRFNIGYRHILQVVPFFILLASQSVLLPDLLNEGALKRWVTPGEKLAPNKYKFRISRITRIAIVVMILWQGFRTLSVYPHYEAYFNEIVGGPENGSDVLVDSNIDWGQDLPALQNLLAHMDIDPVYLSYFGTAPPEAYGLNYKPIPGFIRFTSGSEIDAFNPYTPPPGWYAISATSLHLGLVRQNPDLYAYFRSIEPVAKAGYSIHIYEVTYPDTTPVNRTVVVGEAVSDLSPEALGIRPGKRLIVKWADSLATTIIPAGFGWEEADYQEVSADFSGAFELMGYELGKSEYRPGDPVELTLYWLTNSGKVVTPSPSTGNPLAAFVHLVSLDSGQILAQFDGWGAALSGLEQGDIIIQKVNILIPDAAPAGNYHLLAGLYSPQSGKRLPITIGDETTDFITVATIQINNGRD